MGLIEAPRPRDLGRGFSETVHVTGLLAWSEVTGRRQCECLQQGCSGPEPGSAVGPRIRQALPLTPSAPPAASASTSLQWGYYPYFLGLREHQMAYNLQARRPEPGTCWLSSLLLSVCFMPCPCSVLEASWHFLGDMKCSETLAWVSASRSLMSWPLGWQSPVPTATQSPHGEAAWPLSASLTPRCPCLRQGQSHTDSWRRLALRSGATSDHVWGRWLISEMIHVLRGRRQTLQVSSQGTGQPGSPHWRG